MRQHTYTLDLEWTPGAGEATTGPRDYSRNHVVSGDALTELQGSSDPAFRGDRERWNPEQLLVASLAQCHMLWYLGLAAEAGLVVSAYVDEPTGTMVEDASGAGQFTEVVLRPHVTVRAGSDLALAARLHGRVGDFCFIARSVNFPVRHAPTIVEA